MNPVKQKLRSNSVVLGQMVLELFTPGIAPMLAAAGLEFVIYDMEHGRCDLALAAELILSAKAAGLVPIVRVPDSRMAPLSRVLDLGARGVMIPRIETRAEMEDCVAQLRYPPQGRRGVALGLAHDNYRAGGASYFPEANEDTLIIAILETVKAYENLHPILSVPGLDIAWMGHYDLTTSMGIPGQFDHPRFLQAMDALIAGANRYNIAAGFLPPNPAETIRWIKKGFRAISLGSDVGVYLQGIRTFRETVLSSL
jgi:2-keto-3-deoxy-L-rhamnonate aldolase RhmA